MLLPAAKSLQSCPTLLRPHGLQLTRLLRPWDSPGKNTGLGCHFLLQCMKLESESEVIQSCLTLSDPMDCSLPGSSIHGIFQARVLEWVAIAFSECVIPCQKTTSPVVLCLLVYLNIILFTAVIIKERIIIKIIWFFLHTVLQVILVSDFFFPYLQIISYSVSPLLPIYHTQR